MKSMNGKIIGILTYHFSINYGAVLQCYALQSKLEEMGARVYVINHVTRKQNDNNLLYSRENNIKAQITNIAKLPLHKKRKTRHAAFKYFVEKYLHCTNHVDSQDELNRLIEELHIEYIFVGSDQVWSPLIYDFDKCFFLEDINAQKKIGYAISIGKSKTQDLEPFSKAINNFYRISVREPYAKEIVGSIIGKNIDICVDPALLLSKEKWISLSEISKIELKQPYLLCFLINRHDYSRNYKISHAMAKEKKLNFLFMSTVFEPIILGHDYIINAGPIDFLYLMSNADYICTDTFHGTVFSYIFRKEFVSFRNESDSVDTRKYDFLNLVGLQDRFKRYNDVMPTDSIEYVCNDLMSEIEKSCDFIIDSCE